MANRLTKYIGTPDNTNLLSLNPFKGIIDDPIGWIEDHSPVGITQGFVDELVSGDGSGVGADVADYITEPFTGSQAKEDAYTAASETLAKQMEDINKGYEQAAGMIGQSRDDISALIGPEYMKKYGAIAMNMRPGDFVREPTNLQDFAFNRDVSQFLDPNADYVIDQSVNAALQAMSGQGGITGGAAARALQAEASQKAGELYGEAWDRMMKATEQEYGKERDVASIEQDIAKQKADREKNRMGYLGNLGGMYVGNLEGKNEDLVNLLMAQMGSNLSLAQAIAQLGIDKASQPTTVQQGLGIAGDAANIINFIKGRG